MRNLKPKPCHRAVNRKTNAEQANILIFEKLKFDAIGLYM